MSTHKMVKVDKVWSTWFSFHFDQLQTRCGAACALVVKVVKVNFTRIQA
jgi:hypothetical protein